MEDMDGSKPTLLAYALQEEYEEEKGNDRVEEGEELEDDWNQTNFLSMCSTGRIRRPYK